MSANSYQDYNITAKQVATNERSAAARLDRQTEDRLYGAFRAYFQAAEDERRWNVWTDIDWDTVGKNPSEALTAAMTRAYHDELFLPDYAAHTLAALRASRGRAWFVTRWTYEEGKHLLALSEWLQRAGIYTNDELRAQSDELLNRFTWEPPYWDAPAVFADALLWELKERDRYKEVQRLAQEEGDAALMTVIAHIQSDEEAHRRFLGECLQIIGRTYPEQVADAVRRVAEAEASGDDGRLYADALLRERNITA